MNRNPVFAAINGPAGVFNVKNYLQYVPTPGAPRRSKAFYYNLFHAHSHQAFAHQIFGRGYYQLTAMQQHNVDDIVDIYFTTLYRHFTRNHLSRRRGG